MTRHIIGEYAEALKELCNSAGKKERLHEELGESRLQRDRKDVQAMKEYLSTQCQDPFNLDEVSEQLINITTSQVASLEVENSLKGIPQRGKDIAKEFISK